MKLWRFGLLLSLGLSLGLRQLPAQAQVADSQVNALVEALRLAAPQTGSGDDGYYSQWQVKPDNVTRWSKSCLGKTVTPAQFETDQATARQVITCVMRDVLRDEYRASGNNEALAVRRSAAWWMTGDPTKYDSKETIAYTQVVLNLYQKRKAAGGNTAATPSTAQPATTSSPAAGEQPSTSKQGTPYDRYMKAGYAATEKKQHQTALLYFKRALDERPSDTYATQAIRNVEAYLRGEKPPTSSQSPPQSTLTPVATTTTQASVAPTIATATIPAPITQQQALTLINQWLQAKAQIFAPPFDQQQATNLTTGELYDALVKPDGVLTWLKTNQAYYRYGVQTVDSIERFAANQSRATIEVKITEDRTLYLKGAIAPQQTDFSAQQVRYSLELVNGSWKIADYKTVDGALLERSVLAVNPAAGGNP
ncbi:ARC6/PARC6 family protein [Pantanalinema rosaneae CENA516]|uniref:ARC6/PARC6 family protein n=1 Tax=Pantanalinema rosaneae TaxID=1620701 RepID=UPI003D6FB43E